MIVTSATAAAVSFPYDWVSVAILVAIAITTILARHVLMPAINASRDQGAKTRFKTPHSLSILITLTHVVGATLVPVRLAAGS